MILVDQTLNHFLDERHLCGGGIASDVMEELRQTAALPFGQLWQKLGDVIRRGLVRHTEGRIGEVIDLFAGGAEPRFR